MSKDRKVKYTPRTRRRVDHSQASVSRRMRELFIDAYGLFDTATDRQIEQTRAAMREVVEDEAYWIDLKQLVDQKAKVQALIVQLKTPRRK